jgi:hypothetical protein
MSLLKIFIKITVPIALIVPTTAIIKLRRSMYKLEFTKTVESAIYSIPYKIQKLIPRTGIKSGIEDA